MSYKRTIFFAFNYLTLFIAIVLVDKYVWQYEKADLIAAQMFASTWVLFWAIETRNEK